MENIKDWYFTINTPSLGEYKEKGSKFLAFAFPVSSEAEIATHLEEIRKKYYDARHYCYAYLLGADGRQFRANDDGEPGNSAGAPILQQIRSFSLTEVLVIVVRYFGGTKLGVSGLINAYKTAAQQALSNAVIKEVTITKKIKVVYPYTLTNEVMRVSRDFEIGIYKQEFTEKCETIFEIRLSLAQKVFDFLNEIYGAEAQWYLGTEG